MRITVTEIQENNGIKTVTANTNIGKIRGIWKVETIPPVVGMTFCVEFDIDNGIIQRSVCHRYPEIYLNGDTVHFNGVCECIEDIYWIRFSLDWLEMAVISQGDDKIQKGDFVCFSALCENIGIYPY